VVGIDRAKQRVNQSTMLEGLEYAVGDRAVLSAADKVVASNKPNNCRLNKKGWMIAGN